MLKKTSILCFLLVAALCATAQIMPRQSHDYLGQTHRYARHEARDMRAVRDYSFIADQPEGELRTYTRSGYCYDNYGGWAYIQPQTGHNVDIVYAPDGKTVYIKDPITMLTPGTWAKATIEGNTIHLPMMQCILYDERYGRGFLLVKANYTGTDDYDFPLYAPDFSCSEMTYTVNAEQGIISLNDTEGGHAILTVIYSDDDSWGIYGDYDSVYTPFTATPTTMPEGIETQQWIMGYNEIETNNAITRIVRVGIDGDQMYVAGISPYDPESVIVGTIGEDDQVRFSSDQYIGDRSGYTLYFVSAEYVPAASDYDDYNLLYQPELIMDYDSEQGMLISTSKRQAILLNACNGTERIYCLDAFIQPSFTLSHGVAGVPKDPVITMFDDSDYAYYDYVSLGLDITPEDIDGNAIEPAMLYYQLYKRIALDIEPFVFSSSIYPTLSSDMVTVPYDYELPTSSGGRYIYRHGERLYLYDYEYDDLGVQTINYSGGEEHRSNVVWVNGSVTPDPSGVGTVLRDDSVSGTYDLAGRKVGTPQRGIVIKDGRKMMAQ